MTDIEHALALLNDDPHSPYQYEREDHPVKVLCRAIEQHGAFKQKVSDEVGAFLGAVFVPLPWAHKLQHFVAPEPDPRDAEIEKLRRDHAAAVKEANIAKARLKGVEKQWHADRAALERSK
jgi:hypothetical protein